jgi:hypothetical protein
MALAFINRDQNTVTSSATTSASTAGISHTAGNLLVAYGFFSSATGASSITLGDTAGNSYTGVGSPFVFSSTNVMQLFYKTNCLGNASNVVTSTCNAGNSTYMAISVRQFSGAATTSVLEASPPQATGTGTAVDSGSVTVTASEAVIMAGMFMLNGYSGGGSGYVFDGFGPGGSDGLFFSDEYKIVTASESATATATSGLWAIVAAAFKISTSPPPPPSGGTIFQSSIIG